MGIESSKVPNEKTKERKKNPKQSQQTKTELSSLMEIEYVDKAEKNLKNALEKRNNLSSQKKSLLIKETVEKQSATYKNSINNEKELKIDNNNQGKQVIDCQDSQDIVNNVKVFCSINPRTTKSDKQNFIMDGYPNNNDKTGKPNQVHSFKGGSSIAEFTIDSVKPHQELSETCCFRIINNQNSQTVDIQLNQNYYNFEKILINKDSRSSQIKQHQIPTTRVRIEWKEGGKNVFLAGSYNDWKITKMVFDELLNLHFCVIVNFIKIILNNYYSFLLPSKFHLESTILNLLWKEDYFHPKNFSY